MFLPKNEQTNSALLLVDLFLFIFWKKVKTPRRHFEINWPLTLELAHIVFKFSRNILFSDVEFLKRFVLSVKPKYILTLLLIVDLDDLYFWVIHLEQKKKHSSYDAIKKSFLFLYRACDIPGPSKIEKNKETHTMLRPILTGEGWGRGVAHVGGGKGGNWLPSFWHIS